MLHVQIAKEIDITHRTEQLVLQIDVVQLCDITVDDDVGIEVQHLVIERQKLLNQETIVRSTLIWALLVESSYPASSRFTLVNRRFIFGNLEEAAQTFLLVPCDVALQHRHIVEVVRIGVLHG